MTLRNALLLPAALLAAALPAGLSHADVEYEFFLVESFNPTYQYAQVSMSDINEQNVALGSGTGGSFTWTEATEKILLPPISMPQIINNFGIIAAGPTIVDSNTGEQIVVPEPSPSFYLPVVSSINDNGVAVGNSSYGGPSCEPFNCPFKCSASLIWTAENGSSHITNVPDLKALVGVNNHNVAIGLIITQCTSTRGIVYDLDTGEWINLSDFLPPLDLVGLPAQTRPRGISDAGHVVGEASFGSEPTQEFIWTQQAGFTFLPAIPGGNVLHMDALSVNVHGQVVGRALDEVAGQSKAFIWDEAGGIRDLNTLAELPTNFILNDATRINDNGWIVGTGHFGPGWATQRGFVLKPIDNTPANPADLTGDGVVDGADLAVLLGAWGPCVNCDTPADCPADLDGDCEVTGADLAILLGNWG